MPVDAGEDQGVRKGPFILIGAGALAFIVGALGLWSATYTPRLVTLATQASPALSSSPGREIAASQPVATPASPTPATGLVQSRTPVARISIVRIGIRNAPIYDRGTDSKGNMLIAPGYAVTHYSFSAAFGAGNAVIYGHDDINGNIFGHLYDLGAGDIIQVTVAGQTQSYRVTGHQIVPPNDVAVMNPTGDIRLTIITCWPFNVDTKRWIVTATKV